MLRQACPFGGLSDASHGDQGGAVRDMVEDGVGAGLQNVEVRQDVDLVELTAEITISELLYGQQ